MLLAADIGATKTILALYSSDHEIYTPLTESEFLTSEFPDLESLVAYFLREKKATVSSASMGIAAPIKNGQATMINMPWVVSEKQLKKALGIARVRLLNDLEAIAYSVPILRESDIHTLHKGIPDPKGSIAVIAPGTGLGEAFLIWSETGYNSYASEGGHTDFAPSNPMELELLRYLWTKFDHVSYERVCSGPGIYNIYNYLKTSGNAEEPAWLASELAGSDDPTAVIVNAAKSQERSCRICEMTVDIFTSVLGAEAGNLALKVLSTNGVFIGGGIPPRILNFLIHGKFMQLFKNKGRESFIVSDIPVHVVLNQKAGLLGAAYYGLTYLEKVRTSEV